MRLQLDLSREEIEQIILNHATKENGLQRSQVSIEWDSEHNLKIVQEEPTQVDREWLAPKTGDGDHDPD